MMPLSVPEAPATRLRDAANLFITVQGTRFAYRSLGAQGGRDPGLGSSGAAGSGADRRPVLEANDDTDIMVPNVNSRDLATRIPVRNW